MRTKARIQLQSDPLSCKQPHLLQHDWLPVIEQPTRLRSKMLPEPDYPHSWIANSGPMFGKNPLKQQARSFPSSRF